MVFSPYPALKVNYFDVDADEIFNICKNDIPVLHEVIKRMIADQK